MKIKKVPKTFQSSNPISEQSMFGGIIAVKSNIASDSFINNKEVEAKTDYIFYANGNVLSKSYRNNRLCAVSLSKEKEIQSKRISELTSTY